MSDSSNGNNKNQTDNDISFDEFDELINPAPETTDFDRVVEASLSRRDLLKSVVAFGSIAALGGYNALSNEAFAASSRIAFTPIPTDTADGISLPAGYKSHVVARWGDPLWSGVPEFDDATRGTAASQEKAFGDNIDGMDVFAVGDKTVIVINTEYSNRRVMWGNYAEDTPISDDDIVKIKMA